MDGDGYPDHDKYIDDEEYIEGFVWNFCEEDGLSFGYRVTKHKACVNRVLAYPLPSTAQKRKAEQDLPRPTDKFL